MDKLTIRQPDDFHIHLRSGEMLKNVIHSTDRIFGRALAMGNLPDPVATGKDVIRYRNEIMACAAPGFQPIMSVMLVKTSTPEILAKAFEAGAKVLKLIPRHTSTGSEHGASFYELEKYYPVIEKAEKLGMIFSVHFELAAEEDGTPVPYLERVHRAMPFFHKLAKDFSDLKIVAEHMTTKELIDAVAQAGPNVAGTLTYHHAVVDYAEVMDEKENIKDPFKFCLPVARREADRRAVVEAMVSGNPKFFFGSDSASHPMELKMSAKAPAGIFSAPVALPGLAEIFEAQGKLDKLEDFVSRFGAEFYGLPLNSGTVTLVKEKWIAPETIGNVKVFRGGEEFGWKIVE